MLTITHDLRPRMVGVRDQGPRLTCLAFAFSDAHAFARGCEELAPDYLYYHASTRNGLSNFDEGLFLDDAAWALERHGQPAESDCPYMMILPSDVTHWPAGRVQQAVFRATTAHRTNSVDEIVGLISDAKAPVVVIRLSNSFFTPNEDGVVVPVLGEDDNVGSHAVICVGLGAYRGREVIMIRNSWGPSWGDHGYAWVYRDYLTSQLESISNITP